MTLSQFDVYGSVSFYCLILKIHHLTMILYSFFYKSSFSNVKLFFSVWGPHKHRSELLANKAQLLLRITTMEQCMLMIKKCKVSANLNDSLPVIQTWYQLLEKLYLEPPNLLHFSIMLD